VKREGGGQSSVAELVGVGDFEDSLVGRISFGNGLEVYSSAGYRNSQRGRSHGGESTDIPCKSREVP
jgi:hypothetical protein